MRSTIRILRVMLTCIPLLTAFPLSADAAAHHSPPLGALGQTLPAARSGQSYSWKLKVEGGTPPYRCVEKKLDLGTLTLTTRCEITGIAPVVDSESVTGPFTFTVSDSSSPKKTANFPPMNFTVLPTPSPAVPAAPVGFTLLTSGNGDRANGWIAEPANQTVVNPLGVDIRVTGGTSNTSIQSITRCQVDSAISEVDKNFTGAGLFVLPIAAGASSCAISVTGFGPVLSPADFTVQIYAQTSGTPTPTTTTPSSSTDAVSPTTFSVGPVGGCSGGTITAPLQITAASNVSWTVSADPNSSFGQVVTGSGSGSGPFTVTIYVAPQIPTFNCTYTIPMNETTLVDVKFSNGTIIGVTVNLTYTYVE